MNFDSIDLRTFQPLADRILVVRHDEVHPVIIIPDAYRTPDRLAEVLAIGPKVKEVKVGDVVLLPGIALTRPDFESEDYAVVTEGDVGGIMEGYDA